ncbi:hypothetical protein CBM2634_U480004 [Cupriavidus taiwanensis]|uniref:Transposase n=1 Tax=Cupriavidus taiwanensis TaxID=164546 RepID=A0A375JCT6_9BURK|nr:hypothetical protein CBM2634_U480004 [Cupriavidus taiwanensis]
MTPRRMRVSIAPIRFKCQRHGRSPEFERFATFCRVRNKKTLRTDFKVRISQMSAISGGSNGNI